ncbi:hypothetical protein F5Y13DRAFT_198969 [Hypoxylon sp. FL1857]|nr:hypothetical protein F5Y13DRAFT_198969 [Hypoxylon sp. FL1857]
MAHTAPRGLEGFLQEAGLNIAWQILGQLDTVRQLGPVIRSHRIFYTIFKANSLALARAIVSKQIPSRLAHSLFLFLVSANVSLKDYAMIRNLLTDFAAASSIPAAAGVPPFNLPFNLSFSGYYNLSENYAAAKLLVKNMADETMDIPTKRLGLTRQSPEITSQETFRLMRAFLRYQLMCNLFCRNTGEEPNEEANRVRSLFFSTFSPWVNEQMLCVYAYLERKVTAAFDDLVAHDVEWGKLGASWDNNAGDCHHIQRLLSLGLPFLSSIARADTYEERSRLLKRKLYSRSPTDPRYFPSRQLRFMAPQEDLVQRLHLSHDEDKLESYSPAQLGQFARPSDGAQDGMDSSPYRVWFATHMGCHVRTCVFNRGDWSLWQCGHVLWDYTDDVSAADLRQKFERLIREAPEFERYRNTWVKEDLARSQGQRADIFRAAGRGYWPRSDLDFSRILGMDEDEKKRLVEDWQQKKLTFARETT